MNAVALPHTFVLTALVSMLLAQSGHAQQPASESRQPANPVFDRLADVVRRVDKEQARAAPIGAVVAFAGPEVPDGWLPCDGRAVSSKDYPELSQLLKQQYGKGATDDETRLPDYRGMFLRGADDASIPVGVRQGYATALPAKPFEVNITNDGAHSHAFDTAGGKAVIFHQNNRKPDGQNGDNTISGADNKGREYDHRWDACVPLSVSSSGAHHHPGSTIGGGDSETRPPNVSVHFLIRVTAPPDSLAISLPRHSGQKLQALASEVRRLDKQLLTIGPVGMVDSFASPTTPEGWLPCDGRPLSHKSFAALGDALVDVYGKAPKVDEFLIPDYRTMFLRGVDDTKVVDRDRDARNAPSDTSRENAFLGSTQPSATALPTSANFELRIAEDGGHTHDVQMGGGKLVRFTGQHTPNGLDGWGHEIDCAWDDCKTPSIKGVGTHHHPGSTLSGGDPETHPANASVRFLIRSSLPPIPIVPTEDLQGTSEQVTMELANELSAIENATHHTSPVGRVIAYAAIGTPKGWIPCDGGIVNRKDFPALFQAIGTSYGKGATEDEFRLPDYRGLFLRGADEKRLPLGTRQAFATALPAKRFDLNITEDGAHSHALDTHDGKAVIFHQNNRKPAGQNGDNTPSGLDGNGREIDCRWDDCQAIGIAAAGLHHHAGSTVVGGDPDTHPANMTVRFLIQASELTSK